MKNIKKSYKYAQVLVSIPNLDTKTFSYLIPDEFKKIIDIGTPVTVPFGRQGGIPAYVVGFTDYLEEGIKAKSIYELLDEQPVFDLEYLKFLEWMSNYYCCPWQTVIETAVPTGFFSNKSKRVAFLHIENIHLPLNEIEQKIVDMFVKSDSLSISYVQQRSKIPSAKFFECIRKLKSKNIISVVSEQSLKSMRAKTERWIILKNNVAGTKRQQEILDFLIKNKITEIKLSEFIKETGTTSATVEKLVNCGNLEIFEKQIYRNALQIYEGNTSEFFALNNEQEIALEKIKESIDKGISEPLLLYGITGSGKTEVYIHAMRETLNQGKKVIFLVPEIALSSQLAKRITQRFGIEKVAIWHSNISEGERFDIWNKIRNNELDIIIGARSAVFAPLKDIGLIILDEEHESSYKQTSPSPRYNAKDIAIYRAKQLNATLILGSATPDVLTFYKAMNQNRILYLTERFGNAELAKVHTIDIRNDYKKGVFSQTLLRGLERTFSEGKQAILLINRRGFATTTLCKSCGHTIECEKCSIPMIYHKTDNNLKCHYCNFSLPVPEVCPKCGNPDIKSTGLGTQRVEEDFKKIFPDIVCARIDSDIMSKKNAYIEIIEAFSQGKIQVLIGTQMIAKGLDMPDVTLVGVISADSLFNMPDFRSVERGFQLLTQVAGRAGRGEHAGKVYFQSYTPDFHALKDAKEQNYLDFYKKEIESRYEFSYPPYSKLVRLILSSPNKFRTEKIAREITQIMTIYTEKKGISEKLEILGPTECIISKIKDEYRFQILIKNRMEDQGHNILTSILKKINVPKDIKFLIDVDPTEML
ncbi:MAG: primosomal protein N' [bacterium]